MGDLALFADWNDALTGLVHALGGHKKVGSMLRPELNGEPERAAQWLRDCLNPEKRERLNPEQVFMLLRLGREAEYHAAKHWMDAELGYEQGRPLNPQDEAARLQRQVIEAAAVLRETIGKLERLTQPALKNVA